MNTKHIANKFEPVIDWELGTKLAANKQDLAKELLSGLANGLPASMEEIKQAHESQHLQDLQKHLHKLHGAVAYCGTPRLKKALSAYEKAIKKNETGSFDAYFADLELEVAQLLHSYKDMEINSNGSPQT
jgi:HPt (histidine-containing phosphotransfer) domain-containing protein